MIELRWIQFGPNRQLEYRQRTYEKNNWGDLLSGYGPWSDWKVVPTVSGEEAAYEDLRASGGIVGAP